MNHHLVKTRPPEHEKGLRRLSTKETRQGQSLGESDWEKTIEIPKNSASPRTRLGSPLLGRTLEKELVQEIAEGIVFSFRVSLERIEAPRTDIVEGVIESEAQWEVGSTQTFHQAVETFASRGVMRRIIETFGIPAWRRSDEGRPRAGPR